MYPTIHSILDIHKENSAVAQTLLTTPSIPTNHLVLVAAKLLYYKTDPLTGTTYMDSKDLSSAKLVWEGSV